MVQETIRCGSGEPKTGGSKQARAEELLNRASQQQDDTTDDGDHVPYSIEKTAEKT